MEVHEDDATATSKTPRSSIGSCHFVTPDVPTRAPLSTAKRSSKVVHRSKTVDKTRKEYNEGVVAFIDVIVDGVDYSSTIEHDICKGGGKRSMRLNAEVTHMIFDKGRTVNWEAAEKFADLKKVNSAWALDCVDEHVLFATDDPKYVAKYEKPEYNLRDYLLSAKRQYIRKVESIHKARATPQSRSSRVSRRTGRLTGHVTRRIYKKPDATSQTVLQSVTSSTSSISTTSSTSSTSTVPSTSSAFLTTSTSSASSTSSTFISSTSSALSESSISSTSSTSSTFIPSTSSAFSESSILSTSAILSSSSTSSKSSKILTTESTEYMSSAPLPLENDRIVRLYYCHKFNLQTPISKLVDEQTLSHTSLQVTNFSMSNEMRRKYNIDIGADRHPPKSSTDTKASYWLRFTQVYTRHLFSARRYVHYGKTVVLKTMSEHLTELASSPTNMRKTRLKQRRQPKVVFANTSSSLFKKTGLSCTEPLLMTVAHNGSMGIGCEDRSKFGEGLPVSTEGCHGQEDSDSDWG